MSSRKLKQQLQPSFQFKGTGILPRVPRDIQLERQRIQEQVNQKYRNLGPTPNSPSFKGQEWQIVRFENAKCTNHSELAIFVQCAAFPEGTWFPLSQVHVMSPVRQRGDIGSLYVSRWILTQKRRKSDG